MNRKILLTSIVLLSLVLSGAQAIYLTGANFLFPPNSLPYIHIKSDGSIDPPTAPIVRTENVYALTANITGYTLIIECDDVVFDGTGHTISSDNRSSPAISIGQRSNVTIKNVCIAWFCSAHIAMGGAINCTITNTTIATIAGGAMTLNGCNNCTITNNTFYNADLLYDDGRGETVYCSDSGNLFSENNFLGGEVGLVIYGSNNIITNNIFIGTKKYLALSRDTQTNIVENNTVNGQIISETANTHPPPTPSPTATQTPSNSPTQSPSPSPSPTPTPPETFPTLTQLSPSPATSTPQQPTTSTQTQPATFPAEITYAIIGITTIIIIAMAANRLKRKQPNKPKQPK